MPATHCPQEMNPSVMATIKELTDSIKSLASNQLYNRPQRGQAARDKVKADKARLVEMLATYGFKEEGNTAPFITREQAK